MIYFLCMPVYYPLLRTVSSNEQGQGTTEDLLQDKQEQKEPRIQEKDCEENPQDQLEVLQER